MFVDPLGLANFYVSLTDGGGGTPIDNVIAGIDTSITYSKSRKAYDVNDEKTYYNSLEYMLFHSSQSDLERFINTYYNANELHNPYTDLFFLTDDTFNFTYDQRMTALKYFNKYGGCMKRWKEETGMSDIDGLAMSYAYISSSSMKYSSDWLQEMAAFSTLESYSRIQHYKTITPYQPPADSRYNKYDDSVDTKSKANPNNVKVSQGQQDKHTPGTNNYKQSVANGINRSILNENPQQLLDDFAGTDTQMQIPHFTSRDNFYFCYGYHHAQSVLCLEYSERFA